VSRVTVRVEPPYDVVVGPGVASEVGSLLAGRRKAVIATHRALVDPQTSAVEAALTDIKVRHMLSLISWLSSGSSPRAIASQSELTTASA